MARDFSPGADNIGFGSDASVDNFALKTVLVWVAPDRAGGAEFTELLLDKMDPNALTHSGWALSRRGSLTSDGHLGFIQEHATTDGEWTTPDDGLPNTAMFAVGVTYDRGSTANDPNIYINSTLQAEMEILAPLGASSTDAAEILDMGSSNGLSPFDGRIGWFVYDDSLMTAADVNRHRWWGCAPGGPSTVSVWHPMWTDSLVNKGTAVADGSASAVMASLPRVERMWGSMMGCGR